MQADAQRTQVVLQGHAALGRGALVHAEQRRMIRRLDEAGRTLVGREHGFFDQLVRLVARARHDLLDAAVLVADDLRLGGLEVDRAALGALLQQCAVDLVQVQQMRHQIGAGFGLRPAGIGQHSRHLGVGQPRMRADDRRIELVGVDRAFAVDDHVADHRQPILLRVERAQAVGQLLRQHRNHPPREVHRSGALVGIVVDRLARLDVVADVGDGDDQPPAFEQTLAAPAREGLAVHRVVEVARVLAVDGDQRHVAQVDAVAPVGGAQLVGQRRGLRQRLGRETVRHLVLAHRDLDLHARVVDLAQHLDDAAHRLRIHRRRLGQLDRHHLPHRGIGGSVLRHHDVLAVAPVFGRHQPDAGFVQQPADDRRLAPFDDVEHAPLGAALAVVAHDAHTHAVAVQHRAHFLRRQVNRRLAVVAAHETVPVLVAFDHALDFAQQGCAGALLDGFFDGMMPSCSAQVAELVDALVSGTSG